jgi:hypothetical protein
MEGDMPCTGRRGTFSFGGVGIADDSFALFVGAGGIIQNELPNSSCDASKPPSFAALLPAATGALQDEAEDSRSCRAKCCFRRRSAFMRISSECCA